MGDGERFVEGGRVRAGLRVGPEATRRSSTTGPRRAQPPPRPRPPPPWRPGPHRCCKATQTQRFRGTVSVTPPPVVDLHAGPSPVRPAWLCGRQRAPEALFLQGQCPPSITPTVTAPLANAGAEPPPRGTTDPKGTAKVAASPRSRPGAPSSTRPQSSPVRVTKDGTRWSSFFGGGGAGWVVARLRKIWKHLGFLLVRVRYPRLCVSSQFLFSGEEVKNKGFFEGGVFPWKDPQVLVGSVGRPGSRSNEPFISNYLPDHPSAVSQCVSRCAARQGGGAGAGRGQKGTIGCGVICFDACDDVHSSNELCWKIIAPGHHPHPNLTRQTGSKSIAPSPIVAPIVLSSEFIFVGGG